MFIPTHTVHSYTSTPTFIIPFSFHPLTHKQSHIHGHVDYFWGYFWGVHLAFAMFFTSRKKVRKGWGYGGGRFILRFRTGTSRILTLSYNTPLIYLQVSNRKDTFFGLWATTLFLLSLQVLEQEGYFFLSLNYDTLLLPPQVSNRKDFFLSLRYNTLPYLSVVVEQERYFFRSLIYKTLSSLSTDVEQEGYFFFVIDLQHPILSLRRFRNRKDTYFDRWATTPYLLFLQV